MATLVDQLVACARGETLPTYTRIRGGSGCSSFKGRWLSSSRQVSLSVFVAAFFLCSTLVLLMRGTSSYSHVLATALGNQAVHPVEYPASSLATPASTCSFLSPSSALKHPSSTVGHEVWSENGLMYYTPNASHPTRHPIISLLEEAETKWNRMVDSQSKTLAEAVSEYQRRNAGRSPPRGFDKWFHWCQHNNVLLPDELSPLPSSFELWLAIPPEERYKRQQEAEAVQRGFVFVHDKEITEQRESSRPGEGLKIVWPKSETWGHYLGRYFVNPKRSQAQFDLMKDVAHLLPSFRAAINIDDQPIVLPSPGRREELERAASKGEYVQNLYEEDTSFVDWDAICKASTVADRTPPYVEPGQFSFIHDADAALDPCLHPSIIKSHGLFLTPRTPDDYPRHHNKLLPIFSHSTTKRHADFALTPVGFEGKIQKAGKEDGPWFEKIPKLYWRGSPTGMHNSADGGKLYSQSHRERLNVLVNQEDGVVDQLVTDDKSDNASLQTTLIDYVNRKFFDIKLTAKWMWLMFPWWPDGGQQCKWSDGTCDDMQKLFSYSLRDPAAKAEAFKYSLSIDGNGWSARLSRLMSSKNLVYKTTIFPEWNSNISPAWFSFVPIQNSYDDLYSAMDFFTKNDEVARIIGQNGQCWNEKTWRKEDMQAFMVKSYLEYARLFTPGWGDMDLSEV